MEASVEPSYGLARRSGAASARDHVGSLPFTPVLDLVSSIYLSASDFDDELLRFNRSSRRG